VRRRSLWVLLAAAWGGAGGVSAQQTPLTLERAVDVALEQSRDLEGARLELETARRQVREAWASVFPQVDLSAVYTRNLTVPTSFLPGVFFPDQDPDALIPVRFGADNVWNMQIRAEQPLFRATAFIGVGAAAQYAALQREVVRGRVQTLITRVRIAYYDVLLAEESVKLTENTVARIRQTLEETRKLEQAGLSSTYDVLRLEVELANVEPALRRARNAARATRRALAVELGAPQLDSVAVAGSLSSMDVDSLLAQGPTPPQQWSELVAAAHRQRSEIRQLHLTESLRRAEMRAEQSEYLPEISLFGTYSINAQQSGRPAFFGENEAQRAYGRTVGVQVTLPLFAGMRRPARVAQRRIAIEQVRTQRDLAEDQVESQVRTVLDQLDEARQRTLAQRLGVEQAQRGYQIASAQYREGISSALELTDAENALRQSEFNFAEAVYDYLVALARYDEALGNIDTSSHIGGGADAEVER
jgi:outer membrane protein